MSDEKIPREIYLQHLLDDEAARIRYQHEFGLAGFRALLLINGGSIIGLLTYAGNVLDKQAAASLGGAFLWYIIGLAATTLAYVFSYFSQGAFLNVSGRETRRFLGWSAESEEEAVRTITKDMRCGNRLIMAAVVLTLTSLLSFLVGSVLAMRALT